MKCWSHGHVAELPMITVWFLEVSLQSRNMSYPQIFQDILRDRYTGYGHESTLYLGPVYISHTYIYIYIFIEYTYTYNIFIEYYRYTTSWDDSKVWFLLARYFFLATLSGARKAESDLWRSLRRSSKSGLWPKGIGWDTTWQTYANLSYDSHMIHETMWIYYDLPRGNDPICAILRTIQSLEGLRFVPDLEVHWWYDLSCRFLLW